MAKITKFEIKNFRGIETLELPIADRLACPVITLVGLNESGKTTILEAIAHFVTQEGTISRESGKLGAAEILSLVPIAKKANFTGAITVAAFVDLSKADHEAIVKVFTDAKYYLDKGRLQKQISITKTYEFEEGIHESTSNIWAFHPYVKTSARATKYKEYERPSKAAKDAGQSDLWLTCIQKIQSELPTVAYFPTFLVDVPERIYLSEVAGEHLRQGYYRSVLQDALDGLGDGLSIEQHVVERTKAFRDEDGTPAWISKFHSRPEWRSADSVIQKLSSEISREVIGSWKKVFNRPISAKLITLDWSIEAENATPYVCFGISDGASKYALHERSLGFRWFFLFLLFTRFKKAKKRPTMFLFDEPAANLHARAQTELLKSFDRIVENESSVIYSTHSAHMIEPRWVSAAHIVENRAIDYDSDNEELTFSSPPTCVTATPFRRFVASNPDRPTYFQPILDRLDYVSPLIAPLDPLLVTEGISDFHAISHIFRDRLKRFGISVLPGLGATEHDGQIATLVGRGLRFIIVLDDDEAGKSGADKYRSRWLLDGRNITTLGELAPVGRGKKLETILPDAVLTKIADHFESSNKPTKKQIGIYFAQANAGAIAGLAEAEVPEFSEVIGQAIERLVAQK